MSTSPPSPPASSPPASSPPASSPPEKLHILARRFDTREALIDALAERLERVITSAPPSSAVMLSGGSTPLPAYRALATRRLRAAPGLVLLYSDDRYVPASSEASNYHQTQVLLESLALAPEQVVRVRTELPLAEAANDYDARLAELQRRGVVIRLGLLGLGADGHTASLFTPENLAMARGRRAIAVHRPDGRDGISLTPSVFDGVSELVFVVAGADKTPALTAFLEGSNRSTARQAVNGRSSVEIWCDLAAWPQGAGVRLAPSL